MQSAGYSGTPLAKKLGIKPGFKVMLVNPPDYYFSLFTDLPQPLSLVTDNKIKKNFIHYFTVRLDDLIRNIPALRSEIEPDGMIWISWPKKAAKVETDINENLIRDAALAAGLVDVKVCAIDETWSALKLVIRLNDRDSR